MFRRMIVRAFGAVIAAFLLTVGSMSAANAADVQVSNGNGYIKHIDDGDVFKVCDTRENGKGVTGMIIFNGSIVAAEDDGGDAGCDDFTFNILTGVTYTMKICDAGGSNCDSTYIWE